MREQRDVGHFVGRHEELDRFMDWLDDPQAPWILYIHDATEEISSKGGIGKTWLLRKWADRVSRERPEVAVVMVDFFNVADRDGVAVAERVVSGIQALYPTWSATAFNETLAHYGKSDEGNDSLSDASEGYDTRFRLELSVALENDLQRLEHDAALEEKSVLICFDTFEVVELKSDHRRFASLADVP